MYNYNKEFKRMIAKDFSIKPTELNGFRNNSYYYYKQKLYEKIYSRFVFKNFPESWDLDYFREVLFKTGFIVCCKTSIGVLALEGAYTGVNVYNKPTDVTISNVVLGSLNKKIGVDCELIYFEYYNNTFSNIGNLVSRYALLLAQIDASLNTSLINSRVAHVFTSGNKQTLNTLKQMFDDVTTGKPACFALLDKDLEPNFETWFNNVKNSYIGNDLLDTKRMIMNEFCTEIGINNANLDKKERLNSEEVNANNEETYSLISMWVDNLNACFKRCNNLFSDINVTVELRKEDENDFFKSDTVGRG